MRSWKDTHSTLRRKTADKLSISDIALDNRVLRLSRKLTISQGAALYKIANEAGIKSQRDRALLTTHDISIITISKSQDKLFNSNRPVNVRKPKSEGVVIYKSAIRANQKSLKTHFTKDWIIDHVAELVIGIIVLVFGLIFTALFRSVP